MDVAVYNMQGERVGVMPIDEASLGEFVNPALIKQAYVHYHANLRQGSSRTKNRSLVARTSKKLYKQKGTGNARHGDKTAPLFKGGAHAHSKKRTREDYRLDMPTKMKRKANRNALLAKLIDNEVKIVDGLAMATPKTSAFVEFLGKLSVDRTALVALPSDPERSKNTRLSARNVESVTLTPAQQLTAFDLLNHRYLVIDKAELEAWLTGPSSQTGKDAKVAPKGAGNGAREARVGRPKRGYTFRKQTDGGAGGGGAARPGGGVA